MKDLKGALCLLGLGIGAILGLMLYQLYFNRMHKKRMNKLFGRDDKK